MNIVSWIICALSFWDYTL